MSLRYWFVDPLERLMDLLPRFLVRPLLCAIAFVYFGRDGFMGIVMPAVLGGALMPVLLYGLPLTESIPAVLGVAALIGMVWRQNERVLKLREQLKALETETEEQTTYE